MSRTRFLLAVLGLVALQCGCGTSRRDQLHRVAKDWCETIRASQVIAVYPLTQDVQPGDVYLVQTPIDEQQRIYKEDGFLPLDNHLVRLDPKGYLSFYDHSFLDAHAPLPKDWMRVAWKSAPSAAFPSYAFSSTESGGLNLAIPVSGVPVGLSLLGTKSANGSVNLKDARTIGVDTESLYQELLDWQDGEGDEDLAEQRWRLLKPFGTKPGFPTRNYLRVVTRVYLLGAIDVQLNDARSVGGGVDAGAARPVELFLPEAPRGVEDVRRAGQETYLRGIERMNAMGGTGAPRSSAGADAGLDAERFAERESGRQAERDAEVTRSIEARDEARSVVESPEGEAVARAERDLAAARARQRRAEEVLREAQGQTPPDEEAISRAQVAFNDANTELSDAERALGEAEDAFGSAHGQSYEESRGVLDVRQSAVDRLQEFAPGASFRFTAASARSVSMTETFKEPLVVGYLGFDVPIGVDGELGPPIPTYALLGGAVGEPATAPNVYGVEALQALYDALDKAALTNDEAFEFKRSLDRVARFASDETPKFRIRRDDGARTLELSPIAVETYGEYLVYRGERENARKNLRASALVNATVVVDGREVEGDDLDEFVERFEDRYEERRAETNAHRDAAVRLLRFSMGYGW